MAHIGPDPRRPICKNHTPVAQCGGTAGHFGGGLDAGEAGSEDQHCTAAACCGPRWQRGEVISKSDRVLVRIDIEGMVGEARQRRPAETAAEGKDQPVIGDWLREASGRAPRLLEIDVQALAARPPNADGQQDVVEWDTQAS